MHLFDYDFLHYYCYHVFPLYYRFIVSVLKEVIGIKLKSGLTL